MPTKGQDRFVDRVFYYLDACERDHCTSDEAIVHLGLEFGGQRVYFPKVKKTWLRLRFLCPKT